MPNKDVNQLTHALVFPSILLIQRIFQSSTIYINYSNISYVSTLIFRLRKPRVARGQGTLVFVKEKS